MPRECSSSSSSDTAVSEDLVQSTFSPLAAVESLFFLPYLLALKVIHLLYKIYQDVIRLVFASPYRPLTDGVKPRGRVAVVGAGLTGISSAADLVAHGFEVVIYEADSSIGGIWARVNKTSALQLHSIMYRFHPSVKWSCGFPNRDEILGQIRGVADRYHLHDSIRLNTKVEKVTRHESSTDPSKGGHGRWVINDGEDGVFDGIIYAAGTCGKPKIPTFEGQDKFKGEVLHSSQLDDAELEGKKVVIVGSGASGVEAAELAVSKNAKNIVLLARDDKWLIPRATLFDIMLALKPFGRQTPIARIPEFIIRHLHYRGLKDLSPRDKGLFEGTPIVNNTFLQHIRQGLITYKRGDTEGFTSHGVKLNERDRNSGKGEKGTLTVESADVIVLATGFARPSIDALPADLFPQEGDRDYGRPNLYLQNFSTSDCSVLLTNASYVDAIGVVGNYHINIYARILMLFLLDEKSRPLPSASKTWVDVIQWVKMTSFGETESGLAFFTYLELCIFLVTFHLFKLRRLVWLPFVLFGFGVRPP